MSHVEEIEPEVADQGIINLSILARAAARCELRLERDQQTYRWYGQHVGDYPMPAGRSEKDLGKCTHALVHADGAEKYEVGVIPSLKHPGTWTLVYDFWDSSLQPKIGKNAGKLLAFYQAETAKEIAWQNGYDNVQEIVNADGSIDIIVETTEQLGY